MFKDKEFNIDKEIKQDINTIKPFEKGLIMLISCLISLSILNSLSLNITYSPFNK